MHLVGNKSIYDPRIKHSLDFPSKLNYQKKDTHTYSSESMAAVWAYLYINHISNETRKLTLCAKVEKREAKERKIDRSIPCYFSFFVHIWCFREREKKHNAVIEQTIQAFTQWPRKPLKTMDLEGKWSFSVHTWHFFKSFNTKDFVKNSGCQQKADNTVENQPFSINGWLFPTELNLSSFSLKTSFS